MFSKHEVKPDKKNLKIILKVIQKQHNLLESDQGKFYKTLFLVNKANKTIIINILTPLLIFFLDLSSNNQNTSKLFYWSDSLWPGFGSICPRMLLVPQPNLIISFNSAAFTLKQKTHMISSYKDRVGFYLGIICEIKTVLEGPKVTDRQNENNTICTLLKDYQLQQKLGHKMEKKIRLVITPHITNSQWYCDGMRTICLGADRGCTRKSQELRC